MVVMNGAILITIGLACCSLIVSGQTRTPSTSQSSAASQRQHEIADLRSQVADLNKKLETLESRLNFFWMLLKDKQDRTDSITLNMSDRTFQRVDTDSGFLLVSVREAIPYLNGYKIVLNIGNPLSASYSGFKAKVRWGKAYASNQFS
jgi:hypothetical protein